MHGWSLAQRLGEVLGAHGSAVARAYNVGLGAEPPEGSRGRALGQGGSGDEAPPLKLKVFKSIECPK